MLLPTPCPTYSFKSVHVGAGSLRVFCFSCAHCCLAVSIICKFIEHPAHSFAGANPPCSCPRTEGCCEREHPIKKMSAISAASAITRRPIPDKRRPLMVVIVISRAVLRRRPNSRKKGIPLRPKLGRRHSTALPSWGYPTFAGTFSVIKQSMVSPTCMSLKPSMRMPHSIPARTSLTSS